ncbi:MAG: asparagine synthase (glutamine-hydrolyzing) [Lachnospiraceae bacterium]|nr:asparagine synthase (glutamine-hydrolyzing) [Lachnospiraceae bacterium]
MCGICGFITPNKVTMEDLKKMNATLIHRGPDDQGEELYQLRRNWSVGFGHRRLSIIDLSKNGHQPMHTMDNRVSVIFNGEIYNYRELKKELSDYCYRTACDTEIILAAYLKWGMKFVEKIKGMFAIVLLDRESETLYLIRDRIGKKPLYYYYEKAGGIVFASELKAIMQYPYFEKCVNKDMVGRFLHKQYLAAPDSIFENMFKLEAGAFLKITYMETEKIKYWDTALKYSEYSPNQITDYARAKYELKTILEHAVVDRLIADVPVGAFLSGGYDSSLVCAIAQRHLSRPLQTYCIGFEDESLDEAKYAGKIAEYLGCEHEEHYITEKDMLDLVESIPICYDEPFADSAQIPSMLVSALAKKKNSVVLTGDGGDEIFGGYDIYRMLEAAQAIYEKGNLLYDVPKTSLVYRILTDSHGAAYRVQSGVLNYIDCIKGILIHKCNNFYYDFELKYGENRWSMRRMLLDLDTSLPECMLTKVDRASMMYSLECRCPLLDQAIVEYSFMLPVEFKCGRDQQKRILKDLVYEYIPRELLERPKQGFCVPLDKWLRGALKEQVMDYADRNFLIRQGIFDPDETAALINRYMQNGDSGKWSGNNYSKIVWPYFIFQQWYNTYAI